MAEKNQHFNIQELAEKWAQGKLTPEEQAYLEEWYTQFDDQQVRLTDSRHSNVETLREAILNQINENIEKRENPVKKLIPWKRIAAAASIVIAISAGGYLLLRKNAPTQVAQIQKQDLLPGGSRAILITGGRRILLGSAQNGTIANNGNVTVTKKDSGLVAYQANPGNPSNLAAMVYDTIVTPKGGTIQVKLSDGSRIWMDADSKLRYPERFTANERKVELISGEAYFVVVHNTKQPFKVKTANQTIEDVGTEFNVNAYPDQPAAKTTLIQGSIKVSRGEHNELLNPGQQAIVSYASTNNSITIKNDVDLDEVVAWKNGLFHFDNANLKDVMKQISRWYNVDVVYEGNIPTGTINGEAYRNMKASQVFQVLNYLKVNFRIEGKMIIVTNKTN